METIQQRMELFRNNTVINWHEHVWFDHEEKLNITEVEKLVEVAEKTYTDKLLCSLPITHDPLCAPALFRKANDAVKQAIDMHPDLIMGMCYVNPGYTKEAIYEIERCINDLGMVGLKLYHQYTLNNPVLFPIIEKCIELDIPILIHAGKATKYGIHEQPNISNAFHIAEAAKRYPEANIIMAHISGGGDWEWQLKTIAPYKNVITDMSGSVYDRGIIEETVKFMGVDRVLFGTDGSYMQGVGKILACDLPEADKIKILEGTCYKRFLERGRK